MILKSQLFSIAEFQRGGTSTKFQHLHRPNLGQGCDCRGRRNQRWLPGGWEDSALWPCRSVGEKNVATTSGFVTFYAVF